MVSEFEYYGRVAYEAWREKQNWLHQDGSRIPDWEEVSETIQQAWIAAGDASVKAYLGE